MTIQNNRRRFIAGIGYTIATVGFSHRVFAATERCESGYLSENGWSSNWSANKVVITGGFNGGYLQHKSRVTFLSINEVGAAKPVKLIELSITVIDDKMMLSVNKVPQFYSNDHTPNIHNPLSNIRVRLSRNGVPDIYFPAKESITLNNSLKSRYLSDGKSGLRVELLTPELKDNIYADFDVNGFDKLLNRSMYLHQQQKKRLDKEQCSACYLTTAACGNIGLDDDCWELTTLRFFRDSYMSGSQEGLELIQRYYQSAPALVEKLNQHPNANKIYLSMYWRYIVPSALLIKLGLNKLALRHYRKLVNWVSSQQP